MDEDDAARQIRFFLIFAVGVPFVLILLAHLGSLLW